MVRFGAMNILPPRVVGPLSECSRFVIVVNANPDATVTLVITRAGAEIHAGRKTVKNSKDTIPLDAGFDLVGGDVVNAMQEVAGDASVVSNDGPAVQMSVTGFDAAQVLSHLHQCARGFFLGGMRPGTAVQVLENGTVIGTGDATDGTSYVNVPDGLPRQVGGSTLVARQVICPKPPPSPPAAAYVKDSGLPPVEPFPFQPGQTVPAPVIAQGLTACSRSVQVSSIIPGCDVILEAVDGSWWASLGASDQTTAWIPLPVKLREHDQVTIRQEVARRCEVHFERKALVVGPQQALDTPRLAQIDCNTTPTIYGVWLKPEADVEFSVTAAGVETIYRTVATETYGPMPAPPMPVGAIVKLRQGECGVWTAWSDPQTAKAMNGPPQTPKISREIFSCQDALPIENIFPLNGSIRVVSAKHGELNKLPVSGNIMTVPVAPSFTGPDDVWVEHHVCGYNVASDRKSVHPSRDVSPGTMRAPLFDGDTSVVVNGVVAGARMELWDEARNVMLEAVRTPFSDTGRADVAFSGFGALRAGWRLYAKTLHCGHFVRTDPSVPVAFKAPVLTSLVPASATTGGAALTLTLTGENFRSGAKAQWNNADRPTTFVSATELHAAIGAADLATARSVPVRVINPDGQASSPATFTIAAPAPPPPQGFDELLIQNCNTSTIPGTNIHRPIHIYFRRTDMGGPQPWIPINDSPHDADYNAAGQCPSSPNAGARFSLDDGASYEVVCVDPELPGCDGSPDTLACRRSPVITIRGKAGGGTRTVTVN
jgi:IPT/TIG domain-containing protein